MPGNERIKKLSLAQDLSQREEPKHASPEEQGSPFLTHERRIRSRRSEEAAAPIENAMDVALGTEAESWDRRRSTRRKNAA